MTPVFWYGVVFGCTVSLILHLVAMQSYQRVLVMKAKDGTAECISGKFYYITPENTEDGTKKKR